MNKTYTVTINNLTESDMRDIFYEAIENLGVKAGQQIPSDMVDLKEAVIKLMFEVKNEMLKLNKPVYEVIIKRTNV